MIVAQIDRDYQELDCMGLTWSVKEVTRNFEFGEPDFENAPKVRFRCKDDDGIVYFGGWLLNDNDCAVQGEILDWGMRDSGCVMIEVKLNNEWTQEIA